MVERERGIWTEKNGIESKRRLGVIRESSRIKRRNWCDLKNHSKRNKYFKKGDVSFKKCKKKKYAKKMSRGKGSMRK